MSKEPDMDDIPKSATWILSGSTVAAAAVTLVGLAPRVAGAYPGWLRLAIVAILLGFVFACSGVVVQLLTSRDGSAGNSRWAIGCVATGMVCVVAGTAVLAVSY